MPRLDPLIREALVDLQKGLDAAGARFCIIGALVPEFLLSAPPKRFTNDADAVIVAKTIGEFDELKRHLQGFRFRETKLAIRLTHATGARVDLLPYSATIAPGGTLHLPGDLTFNMAGFDRVFDAAVPVVIDPDLVLPLAPLPLYVVLKLIAYSDRRASKDLGSVLHCLRYFDEDAERRYGLMYREDLVPFQVSTGYLLGLDAARFVADPRIRAVVAQVLDLFVDGDAPGIDIVARDEGRITLEASDREEIAALFGWFRAGLGL